MFKKMSRALVIAHSRFSGEGIQACMSLLAGSLYSSYDVFIYAKDLHNCVEPSETHPPMKGRIIKGEPHQLEPERKRAAGSWEFFCDIYDGVRDFFIYEEAGRIAHISWVYYENDPNRFIRLQRGEAEIKYCLTMPEFRGNGIYPDVLREIQSYLRREGYARLYICVRKDNPASIRGIEKAGFFRAAEINVKKIMGIQCSKKYAGPP